ncbi:MAG: hypothetical protein ACMG6H_02795, partial [Acidobacteriota bacterium]
MKRNDQNRSRSAAKKDLLILGLVTVAAFFVAIKFEAFEGLSAWVARLDRWEGDEIATVLAFLPFALSVFAWRRWKELRVEMMRRRELEDSARERDESYRQLV